MWVSKEKYNQILQEKNEIKAHSDYIEAQFKALTEQRVTWHEDVVIMHRDIWHALVFPSQELAEEVEAAHTEINSWKQKYADEVQKRLALIEQFGDVITT